ncbi:MAG: SPOR domain-containing protein [Candidatus Omnitrophica bacterium]|nr:SPOR domain-containing protein [Candidatus Omnitrophota bacterium]
MFFNSGKSKKVKQLNSKPAVLSENQIQERLYGEFQSPAHSGNGGKPSAKTPVSPKAELRFAERSSGRSNLFGQEIVDEPKTAIVSKVMMRKIAPSASRGQAGLFEEDHRKAPPVKPFGTFSRKFKEEKDQKKVSNVVSNDFLAAGDKPNFQLEWQEWGDRLRSISIWHVLTLIALLVGAVVLFNVFVNLAFDRRPPIKIGGERKTVPPSVPASPNITVSPISSESSAEMFRESLKDFEKLPTDELPEGRKRLPLEAAPEKPAVKIASQEKDATGVTTVSRSAAKPRHVIQVCIYESKSAAEKLVAELTEQGYPHVTFESMQTGSGRKLYRVYCGQFSTFREAQDGVRQFEKMGLFKRFPDGFIRQAK